MFTKTKITIVAAFILGSASAAMAQASGEELEGSQYLLNPNAPVPNFTQSAQRPSRLIEGRNVAIPTGPNRAAAPAQIDRHKSFGGY